MTSEYDYQYLITRIKAVREAGLVERCHTVRHNSSYNNAQHQYGVASLCHLLFPEHPHLVGYALFHDVAERWTGDIPSPVLKNQPELKKHLSLVDEKIASWLNLPCEHTLTGDEFRMLKAADSLELWLWACEEIRSGNLEVLGLKDKIEAWWAGSPPVEPVKTLVEFVLLQGWTRLPETFDEVIDERE